MPLFTPEYAADGYPLLDEQDFALAETARNAGVLLVGDERLARPTLPVEEQHRYVVDSYIDDLKATINQISQPPHVMPVGIAMGQTALHEIDGFALDIFLAKIHPEHPDKVMDDFYEYLNFEVTGQSEEEIEVKHGCLSTAALSPIAATPETITFRAFDRRMNRMEGYFTGFAAAIAWHEYMHNRGNLMVNQPGVSVVNCVPQRYIELSRPLSPAEARARWPLRYTPRQVEEILTGQHPLY